MNIYTQDSWWDLLLHCNGSIEMMDKDHDFPVQASMEILINLLVQQVDLIVYHCITMRAICRIFWLSQNAKWFLSRSNGATVMMTKANQPVNMSTHSLFVLHPFSHSTINKNLYGFPEARFLQQWKAFQLSHVGLHVRLFWDLGLGTG